MTDLAPPDTVAVQPAAPKPRRLPVLRRALGYSQTRLGLGLTVVMVLVALVGPHLAPHSPTEFIGVPFSPRSGDSLLGTDYLGNDVLSRVLWGGRSVIVLAALSTTIGVLLGVVVGFVAASSRPRVDTLILGISDIFIAFPQLVLVLVFVSMFGPRQWLIVLIVGLSHAPRVARLVRSITLDVSTKEFVEWARLIGLGRFRIFVQEVLPNLSTPLLVEYALRLTWSIGILAALSFLGFGVQPPNADWGRMINENRLGLGISVWSVAAPALCIFVFTIGTNLLSEGLARAVAGVDRGSAE